MAAFSTFDPCEAIMEDTAVQVAVDDLFDVGPEKTVFLCELIVIDLFEISWSRVQENYPEGRRINGRVVGLKKYGAFVELEDGVEGLVHISELSWTRKVRHPSEVLTLGNRVEAVVLNVDMEKRRISLSVKKLVPNPWHIIAERYPIGATIEGKKKKRYGLRGFYRDCRRYRRLRAQIEYFLG
ncbi:MAG: S1 RNA-binding domain-containing protein [Thermodesulfobacteriota bacterium]|nr:S1 RNA-binding domain-containing protein [Thermodesulfobacteriota bacterium]